MSCRCLTDNAILNSLMCFFAPFISASAVLQRYINRLIIIIFQTIRFTPHAPHLMFQTSGIRPPVPHLRFQSSGSISNTAKQSKGLTNQPQSVSIRAWYMHQSLPSSRRHSPSVPIHASQSRRVLNLHPHGAGIAGCGSWTRQDTRPDGTRTSSADWCSLHLDHKGSPCPDGSDSAESPKAEAASGSPRFRSAHSTKM